MDSQFDKVCANGRQDRGEHNHVKNHTYGDNNNSNNNDNKKCQLPKKQTYR